MTAKQLAQRLGFEAAELEFHLRPECASCTVFGGSGMKRGDCKSPCAKGGGIVLPVIAEARRKA